MSGSVWPCPAPSLLDYRETAADGDLTAMSLIPRNDPTSQDIESFDCPICKTGLNIFRTDGLSLNECSHCKGIWFDIDELFAYSRSFRKFRSNWETRFSDEEFVPNQGRPIRRCPRCKTNSLVFGRFSEFQVFKCRDCSGAFVFSEVLDKFRPMKQDLVAEALNGGVVGLWDLLFEALRRAGH